MTSLFGLCAVARSPPRRTCAIGMARSESSGCASATTVAKDTCAICLQATSVLVGVASCGHRFCRRCLDDWRNHSTNGDCPTCRAPLLEAFVFAEACDLAAEGQDDEAISKLREALSLCANAPWAAPHYNLGLLLARKRDFIGAEREFRQASELRKDDPDAALNWGKSLICIGRRGEASGVLQRARRLRPTCNEADRLLQAIEQSGALPAPPVRRGIGALSANQLALLRQQRCAHARRPVDLSGTSSPSERTLRPRKPLFSSLQ